MDGTGGTQDAGGMRAERRLKGSGKTAKDCAYRARLSPRKRGQTGTIGRSSTQTGPGTAGRRDTLPARARLGPVGPQVGTGLIGTGSDTGTGSGSGRTLAGAAAPLLFQGLPRPRW